MTADSHLSEIKETFSKAMSACLSWNQWKVCHWTSVEMELGRHQTILEIQPVIPCLYKP